MAHTRFPFRIFLTFLDYKPIDFLAPFCWGLVQFFDIVNRSALNPFARRGEGHEGNLSWNWAALPARREEYLFLENRVGDIPSPPRPN